VSASSRTPPVGFQKSRYDLSCGCAFMLEGDRDPTGPRRSASCLVRSTDCRLTTGMNSVHPLDLFARERVSIPGLNVDRKSVGEVCSPAVSDNCLGQASDFSRRRRNGNDYMASGAHRSPSLTWGCHLGGHSATLARRKAHPEPPNQGDGKDFGDHASFRQRDVALVDISVAQP
jgi:hypothetical protein